jgi:hypothetical protein
MLIAACIDMFLLANMLFWTLRPLYRILDDSNCLLWHCIKEHLQEEFRDKKLDEDETPNKLEQEPLLQEYLSELSAFLPLVASISYLCCAAAVIAWCCGCGFDIDRSTVRMATLSIAGAFAMKRTWGSVVATRLRVPGGIRIRGAKMELSIQFPVVEVRWVTVRSDDDTPSL